MRPHSSYLARLLSRGPTGMITTVGKVHKLYSIALLSGWWEGILDGQAGCKQRHASDLSVKRLHRKFTVFKTFVHVGLPF
jgi:hypothetical protein